MAISVGDAVLKITGDTKELDKSLKDIEAKMKKFNDVTKKVGLGMMAAGTAMAAGFVSATKAAAAEQIGINRLTQQLKNAGTAYDDVKDSLDDVIATTQRKTGYADDEQRRALGDLLMVTNDYKKSLELLPLALDLAASKEMDLGTAAEVVGKVAAGNTAVLTRYGIVLKEGATASEALAEMQKRVGGTAQAAADPMKIMEASVGDLAETIGGALLGDATKFMDKATDIVIKITEWIKNNQDLVRTIAGISVVLIGAGGILFAISQVSKAIIALNTALAIMQALSGPKGWAVLAAGLAIAGGSIWGINELMKKSDVPSFAGFEGQIPGIPGTPVPAIMHAGEYVSQKPNGGNFSVTINNPVVRSNSDIDQIVQQVERGIYRSLRLKSSYA